MRVIKKIFYIVYVISLLVSMSYFIVFPQSALAQTANPDDGCTIIDFSKAIKIQLPLPGVSQPKYNLVPLPAGQIGPQDRVLDGYYVKNMSCYIGGFYRYFSGLAGIMATAMMIYGGIQYVVSRGNPGKLSNAKDTIFSAITGLVLTLGIYVILNFVNPNLVSLKLPEPGNVGTILQDVPKCDVDHGDTVTDDSGQTFSKVDLPAHQLEFDALAICNKKGKRPDGNECYWTKCGSGVCIPGSASSPFDVKSHYCADPNFTCDHLVSHGQDSEIAALCPTLSYYDPQQPQISGQCSWTGYPALGCNNDEGCKYFQMLNCSDLGQNWVRAGCGECGNLNQDYNSNDYAGCRYFFGPHDQTCSINNRSGQSMPPETYSSCSDNNPVYVMDRVGTDSRNSNQPVFASVCCKNTQSNQYKYQCTSGNYWGNTIEQGGFRFEWTPLH